jgi:Rps23 Pro-64 3,4-dihydroxylase Tpa1-like proline 4-hydroxylase
VSELAKLLPELSHTTLRSKYMVRSALASATNCVAGLSMRGMYPASQMTCYPGGGSRYTRHCDNANGNGRKLTALLYLNPGWKVQDGGCLRVYQPDGFTQRL